MVVLQAADMVMAVAADVACGDAGVLDAFSYLLGYFASTLLCELGDCQADDGAVVAGIEADVRFEDGLFDGADGAAVPGLNDDETGLRGTDGGELVEGRGGAVVVHLEVLYDGGAGAAGSDGGQVSPEGVHGLLHAVSGIKKLVVDHGASPRWLGRL